VLLEQRGTSVIQLAFDGADGPTTWTHATFVDGRLTAWAPGQAAGHDLSVICPNWFDAGFDELLTSTVFDA
jgi:hypothetical protein